MKIYSISNGFKNVKAFMRTRDAKNALLLSGLIASCLYFSSTRKDDTFERGQEIFRQNVENKVTRAHSDLVRTGDTAVVAKADSAMARCAKYVEALSVSMKKVHKY